MGFGMRPVLAVVGEFVGGIWETEADLYAVLLEEGRDDVYGDGIGVWIGDGGDVDRDAFQGKMAFYFAGVQDELLVDVF